MRSSSVLEPSGGRSRKYACADPAQRAVGDADDPPSNLVVDEFVDFHDVLRVGAGLAVDDDAENEAVVGVPVAARSVGDRGMVECRDTSDAADACAGLLERTPVEAHTAPVEQAVIELGVGVVEEGCPAWLDSLERHALPTQVTRGAGRSHSISWLVAVTQAGGIRSRRALARRAPRSPRPIRAAWRSAGRQRAATRHAHLPTGRGATPRPG